MSIIKSRSLCKSDNGGKSKRYSSLGIGVTSPSLDKTDIEKKRYETKRIKEETRIASLVLKDIDESSIVGVDAIVLKEINKSTNVFGELVSKPNKKMQDELKSASFMSLKDLELRYGILTKNNNDVDEKAINKDLNGWGKEISTPRLSILLTYHMFTYEFLYDNMEVLCKRLETASSSTDNFLFTLTLNNIKNNSRITVREKEILTDIIFSKYLNSKYCSGQVLKFLQATEVQLNNCPKNTDNWNIISERQNLSFNYIYTNRYKINFEKLVFDNRYFEIHNFIKEYPKEKWIDAVKSERVINYLEIYDAVIDSKYTDIDIEREVAPVSAGLKLMRVSRKLE